MSVINTEKHTPGPWKPVKGFGPLDIAESDPERWCIVSAANDREYLIATIENGQPGDCLKTEACTAHLIAAAPDYHAAVDALRNDYDEIDEHVVVSREKFEALLAAHQKAQVRP